MGAVGGLASAAAAAAGPGAVGGSAGAAAAQSGWQLAVVALLGLAGATTSSRAQEELPPPPHLDKGFNLMSLDQRRRTFFKYEKRIREMSPPEKVFEYFASQSEAKVFSMTAGDMLRSVVPVYPPEGSDVIRAGSLPGEPSPHVHQEEAGKFILKFDIDGDNKIGFDEFLLFRTLLSIPLEDLEVAFRLMDNDGSGKVDRAEFQQLLSSIHARAGKPSVSMRKSVHTADADLHGLMVLFFGADGSRQLSLDAFRTFGSISGRDFACSVVSCARLKHVDEYLDKVQAMPPQLAAIRVTLPEFQEFRRMWSKLRLLSVALEFRHNTNGKVGREDFAWVVQHVMGIQLRAELVDLLFYLFSDQAHDSLNINVLVGRD
ncbi:hypothetical protein CHLNCDRAFT_133931 [Chlorella variabilis]|uniref:EF-hand domain-containing protein n=1 Tax=Chlorella variabilis TaxID=554065 RepID=E1ZEL6_CHLVA|nr:hypothetical protein CHLNCDRAFT_133931 [Chlorella variabilis]EFN55516.1 hypothetical protein CHLNCDRAFT_133931 [Chlorella variabilis]|eukprot:XP_005847618.1 hypothetical protein CHLNCDRAFT_133931 [Chlorella variabilis]